MLFHGVKGLCSVCFMLKRYMAKWFRVFGSYEIESEPDSVFGNDFSSEIRHSPEPTHWIDLSDKNNYEALKVDRWLNEDPQPDDEIIDSELDSQDKSEQAHIQREKDFCRRIQRLEKDFPDFMQYVKVPTRYMYEV